MAAQSWFSWLLATASGYVFTVLSTVSCRRGSPSPSGFLTMPDHRRFCRRPLQLLLSSIALFSPTTVLPIREGSSEMSYPSRRIPCYNQDRNVRSVLDCFARQLRESSGLRRTLLHALTSLTLCQRSMAEAILIPRLSVGSLLRFLTSVNLTKRLLFT